MERTEKKKGVETSKSDDGPNRRTGKEDDERLTEEKHVKA